MKTKRNAEGFAMIEVLLAVVILAIGLLAGSRMQILGLNFTQSAMMRSYATMAANDIIDRMKLNPTGVSNGAYDNVSTAALLPDPACIVAGCTPDTLAVHDVRVWARFFAEGDGTDTSTLLPGAVGTISDPDVATGVRTVSITWSDFVDGEEDDKRNISVDIIL